MIRRNQRPPWKLIINYYFGQILWNFLVQDESIGFLPRIPGIQLSTFDTAKVPFRYTFYIRINSIWSHLEKYHDQENAAKIGKWSGQTKTAIISSKNLFRPQFWAQIVAGVETHRYSPFLGPGDRFFFGKVMMTAEFRKFAIGSTIRL
jgi:hypothetical protein